MSYTDDFDFFLVDKDYYLLDVYKAGSILSYMSMLLNIAIFEIMFRQSLFSPATILMQGLAAADFLTAFSSYGFEPIFQSQYHCENEITEFPSCMLPYPYCSLASHLAILSFTFHNVSYLITTCIGIQKVIAIIFPIWTRNQLTNRKALIVCLLCFILGIIISIPRHFSYLNYKAIHPVYQVKPVCVSISKGDGVSEYSSLYYLMIQTIFMTGCCLFMLMSAVFISFKLITNKFRSHQIQRNSRTERRSIIMVFLVLVIFLVTEVPKVVLYSWWCYSFISGLFARQSISFWLTKRYDTTMYASLALYAKVMNGDLKICMFLVEGIKLFTIIGCISNFIIYIAMSSKMRSEISRMLKLITNHCEYVKELLCNIRLKCKK